MPNSANKAQVAEIARLQFESNKVANPTYTATKDDISGLASKIGKQVTIPGRYVDKLTELDGELMGLGKTIEEWKSMLLNVKDFDRDGSDALRPERPSFAKVHYDYSIGRKTITSHQDYGRFENFALDGAVFGQLLASTLAELQNTRTNYKYEVKRELLGRAMKLAVDAMGSASTSFQTSKAYAQGDYVNDGTNYGVVIFPIAQDNAKSYSTLVGEGVIVNLALVVKKAIPTDTASGEAFIKEVKNIVEIASEQSEGTSLNGVTIGAPNSLAMYIKFGINSVIDVDTLAGAFNQEKLGYGLTAKALPDFGKSAPAGAYAMIVDTEAIKLFPTYDVMRTDVNGEGDFIKTHNHLEFTPFVAANGFIKVFINE